MRPDAFIPEEDTGAAPLVGVLPRWLKPVTLVVVLALLGAGLATWSAGLSGGWQHDLDAGLDDAADAGKPVFAFFTADWCPPCRQLKAGILKDADVMAGLRENHVLVKVDLTSRTGPNAVLASEYNIRGIPTVILIDPYEGEYERFTGGGHSMEGWIRRQAR